MHAFEPTNNTTSSRDNLTIVAPIDDAIAFLHRMTSGDVGQSSLILNDDSDIPTDIAHHPRLQLTHEHCRTDDGFVVRGERLPNCVPTPVARKALTS
jgi:hypothetical protein